MVALAAVPPTDAAWEMVILTAVVAGSTIVAAIAAVLTWRVYIRMAALQAASNEIAGQSVKASEEMALEARRNREAQFAPLVVPSDRGGGGTTYDEERRVKGYERNWRLRNHGPGIAFKVAVLHQGKQKAWLPSLAPDQTEEGRIWLPNPEAFPLDLEVKYEDRFGNHFASFAEDGRFVRFEPAQMDHP